MTTTPPPIDRLKRRYGAVTAAEAAALDGVAADLGVDILQLMEAAGIQVARLGWRLLRGRRRRVHVVAGRGHNGGDGLVAARHLSSWGCSVTVTVVGSADRLDELMLRQCTAARGAGVVVTVDEDGAGGVDGTADLTIDALLGTGLRQPPRTPASDVIDSLRGRILSVDLPSGLDATSGEAAGAAVRAEATLALAACKLGFWATGARRFTGDLYVADIGMPPTAWERCGLAQPSATRGGGISRVPSPT
ncbi:MAG: NAD(P)H-hydrate epimerase [Candidatus Dormibacteraeota bacterium]|nr:NAD(P)H-hydrate epimerase [Candidatus Dormibacteraeota bacterium]